MPQAGTMMPFVITHYRFSGTPKKVQVMPHGNAKSQLPFHPSDKTLVKKIQQVTKKSAKSNSKLYQEVSYWKYNHSLN